MLQLQPGQRVDEFELEALLGAGGFSVVWKARRLPDGDAVALKFPRVEELVAMLRHEADVSRGIENPRVVPVLEARLDRAPPYLVMRWVDGQPLELPDEPPDWTRLVEVLERLESLARVVFHLHRSGVVHGDLKPANVLVDREGRCHVLDLGLARLQVKARQARTLAQSLVSVDGRSIAGTLQFMAPEIMAGAEPSPASDVYSLGVMLHHLATGRPPAFGVDPRELNPWLPPGLEQFLARMLHYDPQQRPPAGAVLLALDRFLIEERRCLAQPYGHQRRRVFQARLATLRRGLGALGWMAATLSVLAAGLFLVGGLFGVGFPEGPLVGLAVLGGLGFGFLGLLLGITTLNAWLLGVPEKTYKERKGHPLWTFMMQ